MKQRENKVEIEKSLRLTPPEEFLGKGVLKICSKFRGAHPRRRAILCHKQQKLPFRGVPRKRCFKNIQQVYRGTPMRRRNHTSVGVFSCKFAAYFQNSFS